MFYGNIGISYVFQNPFIAGDDIFSAEKYRIHPI